MVNHPLIQFDKVHLAGNWVAFPIRIFKVRCGVSEGCAWHSARSYVCPSPDLLGVVHPERGVDVFVCVEEVNQFLTNAQSFVVVSKIHIGGAVAHCSRGSWSDPRWKYGLSHTSSSTERNSVPSLSAEASSIGFAAALPRLGVLAASESSGSFSARDMKRLAADICCIMLDRACTAADRPAPGRQSSENFERSDFG